jgi:hypothetical protein
MAIAGECAIRMTFMKTGYSSGIRKSGREPQLLQPKSNVEGEEVRFRSLMQMMTGGGL